ncbi:MAG: hypothetical protein ACD_71C00233G0008 [uncultured bacterium (gcode 4)]|uniref:Uncharacterized protein n=1 Tax=uncultured bacterium (gcode 4) TaxID=1234023 RepID=K1Z4F6_9BACT|nr:MAG: hypothetical protein ACD_71C00233G0008 [uncultured bacterium (gcode 4)]
METSIFLAKLLGPLLAVVALSILMNGNTFNHILKEFPKSSYVLYLSGLMAYAMGALIVLNHNVWVMDGFVIITVLGYLALVKGILILLFPDGMIKMVSKMDFSGWLLTFVGIVYLFIGLYLSYIGFMA